MSASRTHTFATSSGPVFLEERDAGRTSRKRSAFYHSFLVDNGIELAAAAFEGFTRYGPGAVILWRGKGRRWFGRTPFAPEQLWFSTQLHSLPGVSSIRIDGWEARQIDTYDPHRESVVAIVEGGLCLAFRIQGPISPPDAHRHARAVLN